MDAQINTTFQVLYMLDDDEFDYPVEIGEMGFGLFETYNDEAVGNRWCINDLLSSARPAEYPE